MKIAKRVVLLVQNLPVPFDRRVWQEALSLEAAGYDVTVICPSNAAHPQGSYMIDNISVERFQEVVEADRALGYVKEYFLSLTRMFTILKRLTKDGGHFDLVHYCNPPDLLSVLGWWYKKKHGSATIFDQHDLGPELVRAKGISFSWLFEIVAKAFERFAYSTADAVIATNESYRSVALARGRKSHDDVQIVRSGPPRDWMRNSVPSDKWRGNSTFLVSYVGVIGSQEGLDIAIDAFSHLKANWKEKVLFAIAGGGTEVAKLQALVKDRDLSEQVVFLGRVSDSDLKSLLSSSDCAINPDRWSELNNLSTMNKVIEYMAAGTPIVQFDLKEGRASAGIASVYAKPDDAQDLAKCIRELLLDPTARGRMRSFALERFSKELCWETQAPKLIQLYERLLDV